MIGRKKEIKLLNEICELDESSLVAIYGRRRIGKTYLVNHMFRKYGLNSKKKSELRFVFLTSYGVKMNAEAHSLNISRVCLDDLFE